MTKKFQIYVIKKITDLSFETRGTHDYVDLVTHGSYLLLRLHFYEIEVM